MQCIPPAIAALVVACLTWSAARAELQRAVSLDYCADQYLIALAARGQIAGVSPGAGENDSYLRAPAKGLRKARPTAEEIAPLKPDVVFRFWGGSARLGAALEKFGARVITLDYPSDFDVVRKDIRTVATALGRDAEGEKLIGDLDARLAALAARKGSHPAALYVTPGGVTAGNGTMIDAVFKAAGVKNLAADQFGWPPLPLEHLVLNPPEVIVTGFFNATTEYVNNWSASRHDAFKQVFAKTPAVHLRADVISCPAWFAIDAAEEIARQVDKNSGDAPDAE